MRVLREVFMFAISKLKCKICEHTPLNVPPLTLNTPGFGAWLIVLNQLQNYTLNL